jgi:putative endopeptidase
MKRRNFLIGVAGFALLSACGTAPAADAPTAIAKPAAAPAIGTWGFDIAGMDRSVPAGVDFAKYSGGTWLKTTQIPGDRTRWGAFDELREQADIHVIALVAETTAKGGAPGTDEQRIADFYASFVDTTAIESKGLKPIQPLLAEINAAKTPTELALIAARPGSPVPSPLNWGVAPDQKNPDIYVLSVNHGGLGLPNRTFYLGATAKPEIIAGYKAHVAKMLSLAGVADADAKANAILALEVKIAEKHWLPEQLRERDKTYNVVTFAELQKQYPGYDWAAHLRAQGMQAPDRINVVTPDAVQPILDVIDATPLATWRDYLSFHAIDGNAGLLSKAIDDASFEFNGKVLGGQKAQRDDWKRAVALVGGRAGLGEALGELYVARYFKPESKAAMDKLVENLRAALRQNIAGIDWMGEATKAQAYRKLETFRPKIGYPSKWLDYSSVSVVPGNVLANVMAMRRYNRDDQNRRVGQKTDREEWGMTPQTVNAYYNSSFNEIVFPAGILQPPFFDVNADPAVNYGAIGAVIGHEMGHGFDDQGSKSDFAGIQRNWWTDEDRARFEQRTKALGAQYDAYCPLPGQCVNGALTMGENIGDLGGISMAYTAYKLSLGGKPAPVIDGLTGDQRFFLSWAQVWKGKYRDESLLNLIKTNPHSPVMYRANGPLRNFDPWYQAFDVKPGDAMYLPPEQRVRIW